MNDALAKLEVSGAVVLVVDIQEKLLPADYISANGFDITQAARRYLTPLIVGEAYPPFRDGLPDYVKLQNKAVPKKLATAFAL